MSADCAGPSSAAAVTMLDSVELAALLQPAEVMTTRVDLAPGGDVIRYQAANHLPDRWTRFVAVMVGVPGEPMLTLVDEAELAARQHLRTPRAAR